MALTEALKNGLLLFKAYCKAFGLTATLDKELLKPWEEVRGPIVAGSFGEDGMPPIVWVDNDGNVWIEQDEDLIQPNEPAVAIIDPTLLSVAINNKKRIHPVAA